jgi:hypothetical protein
MRCNQLLAMKKSIILVSMLSLAAILLPSCASEPKTTTTTTRQTTVTTQSQTSLPRQPIGYRDNNMETGGPGLTGH